MDPPLTQILCHNSLPDKNSGDLSPMDLDFSSGMNFNNSNDITNAERQCDHNHHYQQQQQRRSMSTISRVTRNSSFRLPSFASFISGRSSHSVTPGDQLAPPPSTTQPYSNATPSSIHLPRFSSVSNVSSSMRVQSTFIASSCDYSTQQEQSGFGLTHSASTASTTRPNDTSSFGSISCDNNRASFVTQPPTPRTSDSILTISQTDTSPTPAHAKKGRKTRKPKFISRALNSNIQWPTCTSKNNDITTFRPYQHEQRRPSQQQQQQQQHQHQHQHQLKQGGRRRRTSSVGTTTTLTSSSATMVKPRWQETERLDLLKAVVKEKQLDDMTSFSWENISSAVGKSRKACKDQYRREILPALFEKLKQ